MKVTPRPRKQLREPVSLQTAARGKKGGGKGTPAFIKAAAGKVAKKSAPPKRPNKGMY